MNKDAIKIKIKENPITSINIMEIILLFFSGYTIKDNFLKVSNSPSLLFASFENLGGITTIFRIFIVISPIAMLIIPFINKLSNIKILLYKIFTILGTAGIISQIYKLRKIKKMLNGMNDSVILDTDKTLSLGFAVWIMLALYVIQIIYVFSKKQKANETVDSDKTIETIEVTDLEDNEE